MDMKITEDDKAAYIKLGLPWLVVNGDDVVVVATISRIHAVIVEERLVDRLCTYRVVNLFECEVE
jgi:hypothetical protein